MGSIILDFYCPAARLAVDGATHWDDAARATDEARDQWLMSQGVRVHRVPAGSVYHDLGGVTVAILGEAAGLIEAGWRRMRLAPSTTRSSLRSASGPAASRRR